MRALELSFQGLYAVLHRGVRFQDLPCKFLSAIFLIMSSYHGTHAEKEGCVMCQMRSEIERMAGKPGDEKVEREPMESTSEFHDQTPQKSV